MRNVLFPHVFQLIGWIMFSVFLVLEALIQLDVVGVEFNVRGTVVIDATVIGIALGALFIVCSKERIEDEMTDSIRLASLLKSIYVYVGLLVVCTLFINGVYYLWFALYNLILFPIVFVCLFRIEMYRYKKICDNEEQD